jgi:broad specificity phosphatase PhoE
VKLGLHGRATALLSVTAVTALLLTGCPPERPPACPPTAASSTPPPQRLCHPHTVILVRHAEKAAADPGDKDPDLSPKGRERATRLATLLGKASITRLVATEFKRTQQTLAPLSAQVGKPVEIRAAGKTNDLIRELADAPPGSTTVVATHSNVIPKIASDLGAGRLNGVDAQGNLSEDEFSRVVMLSVGCSASAALVELSSD